MNPFDVLRDQLPGWTLAFTALEGIMGVCDPAERTIWIDTRLTARQRRSTMVHEVLHALRGHDRDDPITEEQTARETAEILIPLPALLTTITQSASVEDILDALDVDLGVLRTRIRNLSADESSDVRRALAPRVGDDGTGRCAIARWWIRHEQPGPLPCSCCVNLSTEEPPAMKNPRFANAHYLGGFPSLPKARSGPLEFGTGTVIVAGLRRPVVEVKVPAIVSVEVTGEQTAKSRAGAVALFGVAGLAAKGSTTSTIVTLHMRSGAQGLFRIDKMEPSTVKAHLAPWIAATHVVWHDDRPAPAPAPAAVPVADGLAQLSALYRDGVLTDDEFATAKAKLLAP